MEYSPTQNTEQEQQVRPRKKRVVIGLPGSHFSNNFIVSWTQSLFYLWEQGYNVIVSPAT